VVSCRTFTGGHATGLNERRKIKELQDTVFPGRVKEIEEICGKAIPYDVDWTSLKTVKLVNLKDAAAKSLAFEGGVLTMSCAYAKGLSGAFSDGEIRELLKKKL